MCEGHGLSYRSKAWRSSTIVDSVACMPTARRRRMRMRKYGLPDRDGLCDPQYEHDSCGVGFVSNIQGVKSHSIVTQGLQILVNLAHRGASGCDPETGDGAGILTQIPHAFCQNQLSGSLPKPSHYGVGMVFLPRDPTERALCEAVIAKVVREEGQTLIAWRDVPRDNTRIGSA